MNPVIARRTAPTAAHATTHHSADSHHGQALLVMGGLLLGTLGVFVQEAGQDPLTTVWFRCAFGALALLAFGAVAGWLPQLRLPAKGMALALLSAVLMVLNWALFFAAIPRISLGMATVVFHVQPLWVMALGVLWLREPVRAAQVGAAALALVGLTLATGLGGAEDLSALASNARFTEGLLMCLGGSFSYALVVVLARAAGPLVSPYAMATWQCLAGTVLLAAWPLSHGWPSEAGSWFWLMGLGALHTGLAYVLLYAGMARLPAAQSANLQFVYPAAALGVDWLVYGHALGPLQCVGVGLMGLALWAMRRPPH